MRIIVVDDREEERYLAEALLQGSGYEVVTAVNGAEALEKLRTEDFDMIVSDVLMPVMDGVRFCRECQEDEKLKDIPFVFYTATYKDERDEELASKVGADRYILKPIEPEEFVKIIQGLFRDVEEGKISPKKPVLEEEKEVLKLYSQRLIAKLEKKMLELEAETAQRKQAQERIEHLNMVLRAIRGVNQLIIREKERDKLLKSACVTLIETRGYDSTCICLLDESGMLVTHAEAGLDKDFLPVVERLKRGELTDCIKKTLIQSGVVITEVSSLTCGDCPLVKTCSSMKVVTVRIEHGGKVYGLLRLSLSGNASISGEEQSLLQEVTDDIAFALHDMELEEERKRLEHSLKERVKELQCLYGIADIAGRPAITSDELCREVVNLLPPAWQHPEITYARIVFDDKEFKTKNYAESRWKQSSDIKIGGTKAGSVEVGYLEERPEIDEEPFLKEERLLIDAVAERLGRITERKQAEEELQIAEQNFRHSLDHSPLGVRIVAADGELIYANQAILDIYGYSSIEELKATPLKQRYTPKSYTEHLEKQESRRLGKPVPSSYEISIVRKDGEIRHLVAFRKAVVWGGEVQYQVVYQDFTERKEAEQKAREVETLREVDRLRSGLLANVSHELRTPLTSIKGFATTLLRSDVKWSEEEQRDYLQTIDQETNRLINLISDLLDMSRIEAGGLKLDKQIYHISEILDSVSSGLASLTEQHQLQVIVPSDLPSVFVDQMRIGQVLTNLVENATKYSGEGSPITIDAQLTGDQIVVSVTDRGQGIPAELAGKLFDRFYQVESIVTGRKSGTGLGLSICKGILEAHGGRIWVESQPGEGSKFSFSLPVGKGEEEIA